MIPLPETPRTLAEYVHLQLSVQSPVAAELLSEPPSVEQTQRNVVVRLKFQGGLRTQWMVPFIETLAQIRPTKADWFEAVRDSIGVDRAQGIVAGVEAFAVKTERELAPQVAALLAEEKSPLVEALEAEGLTEGVDFEVKEDDPAPETPRTGEVTLSEFVDRFNNGDEFAEDAVKSQMRMHAALQDAAPGPEQEGEAIPVEAGSPLLAFDPGPVVPRFLPDDAAPGPEQEEDE